MLFFADCIELGQSCTVKHVFLNIDDNTMDYRLNFVFVRFYRKYQICKETMVILSVIGKQFSRSV